ncbi:Sec-independent protein translocase TatB [Sulfuritortus calidifontis]|uniref:Sec-independent protein translocase protein TatB n=1 Tax=Sulfuritortus calidifontis TaxID=1914471 RepID=A0A4R3JWZ1_9PROT|nr:Sec-independent protein translocase protein TatB [Sulfuritortus calidifontis]TCS72900.1 Sec-independent protein translocase TatB [Sulfuritortus calidifontis]
MFDIGFSELLVIGVVALIVIGPERLPKVARTAGSLLGRLNRYVNQVKQDVERDIHLEELRKAQKDLQATAQRFEIVAEETGGSVKAEANKLEQALQQTIGSITPPEVEAETEAETAAVLDDASLLSESPAEEPPQAQMELPLEPEPADKRRPA